MDSKLRRRPLLALAAAASIVRPARADTLLNDASRLSPTPVARHILVPPDREATLLATLRAELKDAAAANRPVAMGAARHSMGGQSLARGGTAFTFTPGGCGVDQAASTFRAGPGTRWKDVIATLDPVGFSPAVMQSNHDFGVASTVSVNAHGWPVPFGPFGSTVRSLRLLLADGAAVTCSRTENAELFGLVTGGYGLFGIILEVEAAMVPNRMLVPHSELIAADAFGPRFAALCTQPGVLMGYGRLNVSRDAFLSEALMTAYSPWPTAGGALPQATSNSVMTEPTRWLYRAQTGTDWVKRARWFMESEASPRWMSVNATRNALLNEPVVNLASLDSGRTDILHEYFVAPDKFAAFLAACREVIPRSQQELLNITLRLVEPDPVSRLAYAPVQRIASVMSFTQHMTPAGEEDMRRMTQALVARVLDLGGSFYLPYRLHATKDQVRRAYPALPEVVAAKRRHDPGLLFRNALWDAYMAELS